MSNIKAVIDIGTNSFLLTIADCDGEKVTTLFESKEDPRLGEGLQEHQQISKASISSGLDALGILIARAREFRAKPIILVGTQVLRQAENGNEFVELALNKFGLKIWILSPYEEAYYASIGVRKSLQLKGKYLIADVGAGSTELIRNSNKNIMEYCSIQIGALHLFEKFKVTYPLNPSKKDELFGFIAKKLNQLKWELRNHQLIGSGGTITTFSALIQGLKKYDGDLVNGNLISKKEINKYFGDLCSRNIAQMREVLVIDKNRADIILPGLSIFLVLMDKFDFEVVKICDKSLRWGIFWESKNNFS